MDFDTLNAVLSKFDQDHDHFKKEMALLISREKQTKTVVGVDLFEYSKMDELKQFFVPFIINSIFNYALDEISEDEDLIFMKSDISEIRRSKIDTGDGFFVILNNPVEAFVFLIHFCAQFETLQSRNSATGLMEICHSFFFRYSISTGPVYEYEGKKYGEAIINCSRIMSLDKLNRFLIDDATFFWFYDNANGLDTMRTNSRTEIVKYNNTKFNSEGKSMVFNIGKNDNSIKTLITQKIGTMQSKNDILDIYNVYLQVHVLLMKKEPVDLIVSIGNLNVSKFE